MTCPICQHAAFWPIASASLPGLDAARAKHGETAAYAWRLCRRCANAYPSVAPSRTVLQDLWAQNRTDEHADARAKEKIWAYRRAISRAGAERSYRLFAPLTQPGRFFDIACGLGETVRMFAAHGWDAEGIDADPSTAPVHRELGIKAQVRQFEDVAFERPCDLIHIAHAIYFITEPMRFLRLVRDRLAPGGVFCVVLADFMANSDASLPAYVHTFFPTAPSMRYALALAGFEVVFSRRVSGSVYIAARPAANPPLPSVAPRWTLMLYRTKGLRYRTIGRPYLAARQIAKRLLGRA